MVAEMQQKPGCVMSQIIQGVGGELRCRNNNRICQDNADLDVSLRFVDLSLQCHLVVSRQLSLLLHLGPQVTQLQLQT